MGTTFDGYGMQVFMLDPAPLLFFFKKSTMFFLLAKILTMVKKIVATKSLLNFLVTIREHHYANNETYWTLVFSFLIKRCQFEYIFVQTFYKI